MRNCSDVIHEYDVAFGAGIHHMRNCSDVIHEYDVAFGAGSMVSILTSPGGCDSRMVSTFSLILLGMLLQWEI